MTISKEQFAEYAKTHWQPFMVQEFKRVYEFVKTNSYMPATEWESLACERLNAKMPAIQKRFAKQAAKHFRHQEL